MATGYKFVIADDHPLFRGALKQALAGVADVATILEAGDFETTKSLVSKNDDIDLILLDLTMPGASGLSGLISLRGIHSAVPMIVVSAHDDPRNHPPCAGTRRFRLHLQVGEHGRNPHRR